MRCCWNSFRKKMYTTVKFIRACTFRTHCEQAAVLITHFKLFLAQTISATLWAGTNSGQVLVFLLNIPVGGAEKRNTEKATAMLAKEIQLKHKAPVINIQVKD